MARQNGLMHLAHSYGFFLVCVLGFLVICGAFLVYRLLLKPLVFGLILLISLPLIINSFRSAPYTGTPAK
jgi:hypothetical protein